MKRAVFLDRDGTLIKDVGYLGAPEGVEVVPGAPPAVRRLNQAGLLVVVVSNQSGVARGMFTTEDVDRVNERVRQLFAGTAARIDAFYYCPHLPTGSVSGYAKECDCRKPRPGLLHQAARDLNIELGESFMVGDAVSDVEAGRSAGCRSVFLGDLAELDAGQRGRLEAFADDVVVSLAEAVDRVLGPAPAPASQEPAEQGREEGEAETPEPQETAAMTTQPPVPTSKQPPPGPRTCSRCGRPVTEDELVEGRALGGEGRCLCPDCVGELRAKRPSEEAGTEAPPPAPEAESNSAAILDELRNITRALTFERFSVMNLVGGVVQVGALGCLFKAYQLGPKPTPSVLVMLFWAIALQLITLTCFTLGRR